MINESSTCQNVSSVAIRWHPHHLEYAACNVLSDEMKPGADVPHVHAVAQCGGKQYCCSIVSMDPWLQREGLMKGAKE